MQTGIQASSILTPTDRAALNAKMWNFVIKLKNIFNSISDGVGLGDGVGKGVTIGFSVDISVDVIPLSVLVDFISVRVTFEHLDNKAGTVR